MSQDFTWSPEDWAAFAERHWEKTPALIRKGSPGEIASPDDVFHASLAAAEAHRRGGREAALLRFSTRQGCGEYALAHDHLPESSDGSLTGYASRLSGLGLGTFMLVVDDIQAHDPTLFFRMRRFSEGLYRRIGTVVSRVKVTALIGEYDRTPFGVHQDPGGVFMFVVQGRKRIRLWHRDVWTRRTRDPWTYEPYLSEAMTLEAGPGDIVYWPSDYFHVGESEGFSASLHLAFFVKESPLSGVLLRSIYEMIESRLGDKALADDQYYWNPRGRDEEGRLPDALARAVDALKEIVRDPVLDRTVKKAWIDRLSGFACTRVPAPGTGEALADRDRVRLESGSRILWTPWEPGRILCAANGLSFTVASHPNLVRMIERLNSGAVCSVRHLLEEFKGEVVVQEGVAIQATAQGIRSVLDKLLSMHAIVRVAGGGVEAAS